MNERENTDWATLKYLSDSMGVVHELQQSQLQIWPLVVFPRLKGARIELDCERRSIKYLLEWKRGVSTGKAAAKARLQGAQRMASWTQKLLGGKWEVQIVGTVQTRELLNLRLDPSDQRMPVQDFRTAHQDQMTREQWRTKFKGNKATKSR